MSNKILLISQKNLAGLQCYVQQSPTPQIHQLQQQIDSFGNETPVLRTGYAGGNPVSASSVSSEVVPGPSQLQTIVGSHSEAGEQSANVSGDEYSSSFQENEDEVTQANDGNSSANLSVSSKRYNGPGIGRTVGPGKCVIYKDGVQQDLSLQEVADILANPDISKLSTMPPVRPRGGSMYLFRCPEYESRHDIRADQYLWSQQGAKRLPKDDPIIKRYYMYIRTEMPIKNISRRPKKTFTNYDVRFKKAEYELIDAEDTLVLVHYIGDETVWKPFRHGNAVKTDRPFVRTLKSMKRTALELGTVARPKDVYQAMMSQPVADDSYGVIMTPRDKEQIRNYLKYHNLSQRRNRDSLGDRKRQRLNEDSEVTESGDFQDESTAAADSIALDVGYESCGGSGIANVINSGAGGRVSHAYDVSSSVTVEDETVVSGAELRVKFDSLWPTFELCHNARLMNFVQSMAVSPEVMVTAANRSLLTVANDLAHLDATNKTDRFEFYYVSAGPVAGKYYLSTLLFRHCLFDAEPIVPAAYLIHERRNIADHRRLFEMIKEKCPDVAATDCVFITDREFSGIESVIPSAVQLYSWHYFEDEVINWVENSGGTNEEVNTYLSDMYALLKAKNVEQFHRDLVAKRRHWPAAFDNFFETCLKSDILTKGGRWNSDGLAGGVYDPFCGVVIPSCNYLNQLVGDLVEWHEATLEQLLQCMYYFSECYAREIERSMHQVGEFKLHARYVHYARPPRRLRTFPPLEVSEPRAIVHHVRMASERGVVITEAV